MKTEFKSAHAKLLTLVMGPSLILFFTIAYFAETKAECLTLIGLGCLFLVFYLSLLNQTCYRFEQEQLLLQLSVFKKRIPYSEIKKAEIGNHLWYVGYKFSTGWKNTIVIRYNTFDDVLISPVNVEDFIAELKRRVPDLEVKQK